MTPYAELDCRTNFSFLEGASPPGELVMGSKALRHAALGVADRNSLAGVVRAHAEAKKQGHRILIGCRLQFTDGAELIVYPRDRAAYGRLCRLLSIGKSAIEEPAPHAFPVIDGTEDLRGKRIQKGVTLLTFEQAVAHGEGLIALAPAPEDLESFEARLVDWRRGWPDRLYLAAAPLHRGDDRARLNRLAAITARTGAPMVATNAVLYADPTRRPLQDVLTCVREKTTIDKAGFRLKANAERFLKPADEMARLFKGHEDAVARTLEIVDACPFNLDELKYRYPDEPVPPGKTATQHLRDLTYQGAKRHWPHGPPGTIRATIEKELTLIAKVGYEHYFLTVHDIVRWARAEMPGDQPEGGKPILCQGRGSAANSVVCYCLGVTSVNPEEQNVLFERFISEERSEPPDIDVDFEHARREEVIQYIYRRYGRHRAAICATVISYRPRSAIRDIGKALGLTEDVTGALASTVWGSWGEGVKDEHVEQLGLGKDVGRLRLALEMTRQLIGFPRHLSQHVGGFVLTQGPLVETVPIGNAAMEDRTFIEWDKDDIDELKIMKVDVLALGMLTAIAKSFDLMTEHYGETYGLADLPREDPAVYEMLCHGDSIGVFQVESRAQIAMLPRLQPRKFYDLVVEVAIVRPGPIQGNMVHPYLKHRQAAREAEGRGEKYEVAFPHPKPPYPADELEQVLGKTYGVPLFQEQAMRIAMVAAEFTGPEANGLRRAMATFRHVGTIHSYEEMMVGRMIARGYPPEFAQNCFSQIKGFGEYGFPESHAAAFAQLVYVSAWIKHHHPEVFCVALLNSQPMGFYAPAQLVRDAQEHGAEVRHPDVNASYWDCTLEARSDDRLRKAVRLGLRQIDGFREAWAEQIMVARPFASLDDLRVRAGLPAAALDKLAAADAFASLKLSRRQGLWSARGLPRDTPAPLFAAAGLDEADGAPPAALPVPSSSQEVVGDYESLRLSLKGHPVAFLRERLARLGAITAAAYEKSPDRKRVKVGGVVLVRQRPGTAEVTFITLEDETGVVNVVVWPKLFEQYRPVIMGARFMVVTGRVQTADNVTHLLAEHLEDHTADLSLLSEGANEMKDFLAHSDGATGSADPRYDGPRGPARKGVGDKPPADPPRSQKSCGMLTERHPRNVRILPPSRDFH
jgi:error-prone DNA polymerase